MCTLIIILENIHTSPLEGIFSKIPHSPLWKFQVGLINFCIFLSHRSSHSLGNSNPFCRGSMDIFKNYTILGWNKKEQTFVLGLSSYALICYPILKNDIQEHLKSAIILAILPFFAPFLTFDSSKGRHISSIWVALSGVDGSSVMPSLVAWLALSFRQI